MINFKKKILDYIFLGEVLELDIKETLIKEKNFIRKNLLIFKVFWIKIFRDLYRTYQRKILKPTLREKFINLEFKILNFFKNNYNSPNQFSSLEIKRADFLKENSYVEIDNIFNESEINEIKIYLKSINKFCELKEKSTGEKMPMKYFKTEDLIKNDLIMKGANNPYLLNVLNNYFKNLYKLDWIWAWWSIAEKSDSVGPQLFHRDYETMNFLKVFVYLTDVINNDGTHQIVSGSHKINKFYKIERFSDDDIFSNFKKEKIVNINGKTGKTFIANTFAIHRGYKPKINDRLVLVYLYSSVPSRRSPKIPALKLSEIQKYQDIFKKNSQINSLFINNKM